MRVPRNGELVVIVEHSGRCEQHGLLEVLVRVCRQIVYTLPVLVAAVCQILAHGDRFPVSPQLVTTVTCSFMEVRLG